MKLLSKFGVSLSSILLPKLVLGLVNSKLNFKIERMDPCLLMGICPKIKGCANFLASVGHFLSTKNHVDNICDGLRIEYDLFVVLINARTCNYSVEEIKSLVMA